MTTASQFVTFVEDLPSKEVLIKIFGVLTQETSHAFAFQNGYPYVVDSKVRKKVVPCINMGRNGFHGFVLLDLDQRPCAGPLLREILGLKPNAPINLPHQTLIRVAVHEIESWLLADREGFSDYFAIPINSLDRNPDSIVDPKRRLQDLVRNKSKAKRRFAKMLPSANASIGPEYNRHLCLFVQETWEPLRAEENSPSLKRTMNKLRDLVPNM
ncbi:MAG: hypothetical protein ACRC46_13520 [Thermoguttaceae bacterium]